MSSELWLGLDTMSQLTKTGNWELRVDLVDFKGVNYTAFYSHFQVEEEPLYRLSISGFDSGLSTIEDSLTCKGEDANRMAFTTSDNDNDDANDANCAELYLGAWWYKSCHCTNLNGFNFNNGSLPELHDEFHGKGIVWLNRQNVPEHDHYFSWPQASMKIKRKL